MLPLQSYTTQLKKPLFIAKTLLSLLILVVLALSAIQLLTAYYGDGFDVDSEAFIEPALIFLLVSYGAARQLRVVFQLLGLRHRALRGTIIPEYELDDISPAEAGVMLDTFGGTSELVATLRSLEYHGVIVFEQGMSGMNMRLIGPLSKLSGPERLFASHIFATTRTVTLHTVYDRVPYAFAAMKRAIQDDLLQKGYLPDPTPKHKRLSQADRVLYGSSILFQLVVFLLIFDPISYRIGYPRYPVAAWQLLYVFGLIGIVGGVIIYSFCSEAYSKKGMDAYRKVAGLYLFLDVALRSRLTTKHLSEEDLRTYEPYALAFNLIDNKDDELTKYLA